MKNGWPTKTLADACEVFADGDWIESKDQSPDGIRLIQTGNVGEGVFKDRGEKARYISKATFKRLRCTEIFEGDCLISRLPDPVGRSCILPDTGEQMITAVDCTIVRFNRKQLLPGFFIYYSQSLDYLKAVDSVTTGTTRNRISRSNLGQIPIPVPALPEQQRIVGILEEAFERIATVKANAEKNLQNARTLFDSHLHAVFTQRGEEWKETTVGDQVIFQRGFDITKDQQTPGDVPVVSSGGIKSFHNKAMAKGPGVVIGRKGTLGKVFYLTNDFWPHDTTLWVKEFNGNHPRFVYHFLRNLDVGHLDSGTANPALNRNVLHPIRIGWPSLAIQGTAVRTLDDLEVETQRLAHLYERKLAALEALKRSLLHQAFTGQL
jgi:type I restriction enzyme, S subunit